MVEKRQSWQLFALYLILYGLNVQIKSPTVLTNGGARVFYFCLTWAVATAMQKIKNVICMKKH